MARIQVIQYEEAEGELKEIYDELVQINIISESAH